MSLVNIYKQIYPKLIILFCMRKIFKILIIIILLNPALVFAFSDKAILEIVAKKFGIVLNNNIQEPTVIRDISLTRFNELYFSEYRIKNHTSRTWPCYIPHCNTIVIQSSDPIHVLAHEYIHFLQVKYKNIRKYSIHLEIPARRIQLWFRDKYLNEPNSHP